VSKRTIVGVVAASVATAAMAGGQASAKPTGPQATAELLVQLKHPRGLDNLVRRVSDPSSSSYRDYPSIEQIVRRYGAGPKAKRAAVGWVESKGGSVTVAATGDFLTARVPAASARRLRPAAKRGIGAIAVPAGLRHAVSSITVADSEPAYSADPPPARPLPPGRPTAARDSQAPHTGTAQGCADGLSAPAPAPGNAFTPNQYLDAYGHAAMHDRGITGKGVRFAVIEIDGYAQSDIDTFGACFGIRVPPIHPHAVGIPGILAPGDETTLDLEVLSAGAPGAKSIEVYENDGTQLGLLESVATSLASKRTRPDVISISLGGCEADLTGELAATRMLNRVFAAASAAGVSVLVSSGDQGSSACERPPVALDVLAVSSPAHSPYVTAVGGTNVTLDAANRITDQVVWNDSPVRFAGGGGGVSVIFELPWWQRVAKSFSGGGRTLPDIAALADITPGYVIYCTSVPCRQFPQTVPGWTAVGGTSAAAPLMASGIALADQAARKRGQETLGLVNPLVYGLAAGRNRAKVLDDVVTGNNDLGLMLAPPNGGPPAPLGCCPAAPGYDAASGLGSLKIDGFSQAATQAAR